MQERLNVLDTVSDLFRVCLFLFHATASLILRGQMILDRSEPKPFKVEKLWPRLCTNVSSRDRSIT